MMRAQVDASALSRALKIGSISVRKSTVPILNCIRIEAKSNRISICGSDLEMTTFGMCDAAVSQEGGVSVNKAQFAAITSAMRGTISLNADSLRLYLTSESAEFSVPVSSEPFPGVSKPAGEQEVVGGVRVFLACSGFAGDVAGDGACVTFSGARAMGRSLSLAKMIDMESDVSATIDMRAAQAFRQIGGRLFISENHWRLEAEGCAATGRLMRSKPIPPVEFPTGDPICRIDGDDLLSAASALLSAGAQQITIEPEDGAIRIEGERYSGSAVRGGFRARCEGECPFICVHPRDLLQMAKEMAGGTAELFDTTNATIWRAAGGEGAILLGQMRHPKQMKLSEAA